MPQTDLSPEQIRRIQFHLTHEDFMRAEGFPGWRWPDPPVHYVEAEGFERWLIDRWLAHARTDEFRQSADYWFLRAEWERGR